MESDSDEVIPEVEPELERVTDASPEPDPVVPPDVHVELPFPYLLSVNGQFLLCAKIIENKKLSIAVMSTESKGQILAEAGCDLTAPPPGEEVATHWMRIIGALAQEMVRRQKPKNSGILVPDAGRNIVTVGSF